MMRNDPCLREFHHMLDAECYRTAVNLIRELYAQGIAPELILHALSQRDHLGNSMFLCMLLHDIYLFDELQAIQILRNFLSRGVPPADILLILAMQNQQGENFFHTLMQPSKSHSFRDGLILVSELLHAAGEQKREFIHAIYQLLMQDSRYLSNKNITVKPFEMISVYSPECIEEYLKFVVKLAREGLSREFVLNLLEKKEHSLLPKFWVEVARQNDQQLLEFISSGFLTGAEYQKFVDAKAQLFGCVLKMDDADKKRAYLENIVDDKHPLGKLFLLKAKSDYRYINKRNGYLKVASDALQQLVPQQMMSGFAKTGAVDPRPRPGAQTTIA